MFELRNMLLYQVYICYFIKTNLDSILKNRDITLPAKVCLVKVMVFPVVMYKCESWIIKKAEHWRIDAFELWCWRRLLGVPWTSRRYNQSILMEISPEYSLEGLMLKLKLQCFGHLMRTVDSNSSVSPSSRGSLFPLPFLSLEWYHLHFRGMQMIPLCIKEIYSHKTLY